MRDSCMAFLSLVTIVVDEYDPAIPGSAGSGLEQR